MRKIYLFFILIISIISKTEASNQLFVMKADDFGEVFFEINIPHGQYIYANTAGSAAGLPAKITLKESSNLKNYKVIWPDSKQKYIESLGVVHYFDGLLSILLEVEAYDNSKPVDIEAELEYAICSDMCIPVKQIIKGKINIKASEFGFENYIWLIALSILGGFILNFMPCVLPVLSLKMLSFLKDKNINKTIACLLTVAGIFSSFWVLTITVIILKAGGNQFGLGANFQKPEFIIALSIIITVFISSALERFDISLPDNFINKLHINKLSNQYLEHYFSGVLAAILSTPCNAPFLGTAVSVAFAGSDFQIFLNFSFVALGFSAPYILMILYPPIIKIMPKSGAWTYFLRKILVVLLAGTIFWLLSILYGQIGSRGTIGLFLLLLLLKFTLESTTRIKFFLALIIVLASMTLPMMASSEDIARQNQIDSIWHKFELNEIKSHVDAGGIVFVDITADWCISCKYNKFMVLNLAKTTKLFQDYNVYAIRGDFTSHNEEIYDYLVANHSYGVPFYKLYGPKKPEGVVLPVIISYSDITFAIKEVW